MARSDKKQILDKPANAGKTQQAAFCRGLVFCWSSVFSKIKARKNVFPESFNTPSIVMMYTGQKFVLNKSSDLLGY